MFLRLLPHIEIGLRSLKGDGACMNTSEFGGYGIADSCAALSGSAARSPESEYARRLGERQQQLATTKVLHQRLWTYLIVVLACAGVGYGAFSSDEVSLPWLLLPLTIVLYTIHLLTNNARTHSRVLGIVNFYELGLARLHHQWQGRGVGGGEFLPDNHAYASDLDLFGAGSLFELLCTARTGVGRSMLAKWLLNPAECGEVAERQLAVAELRDKLDLREYWASVGTDALDQVGPSAVRDWADAPAIAFPFYLQALAIGLSIAVIVLGIPASLGAFGLTWSWAIAVLVGMEALVAILLLKKARLTTSNLSPTFVRAGTACSLVGSTRNGVVPVPIAQVAAVTAHVPVGLRVEKDSRAEAVGLAFGSSPKRVLRTAFLTDSVGYKSRNSDRALAATEPGRFGWMAGIAWPVRGVTLFGTVPLREPRSYVSDPEIPVLCPV